MSQINYQLALDQQRKYEQERRDKEIAKALQETFQREHEVQQERLSNDSSIARLLQEQERDQMAALPMHNRPHPNVYPSTSGTTATSWPTHPSLEVTDPTPDIYSLFTAFNERFFWNQLGSVTVEWNTRMTSSAGMCIYQGRGGMCTIYLSEPLLKLRPRKDLVETLLHEMIHAFLFVTQNNRDWDGHGEEFQRHMYRINMEAGTNITIYHNFYDEVMYYRRMYPGYSDQQIYQHIKEKCPKWVNWFDRMVQRIIRGPKPYSVVWVAQPWS
ncbi:unnamed protein product [Phyllotreta striolata]|uniref:SprT-like domain-containing protein n=1 Tax=Phyllotreta striolata TaxID=444603 RepID=A0A9N9TKR1_PHYSR|nr:unnamed protein product [Phyllotreta striolata]